MRSPLTAAVLLFGLSLSGCTSDGGGGSLVSVDYETGEPVEVEPGLFVAENRGAVRGQVVNDAGSPVSEARVSLIATEFYDDTGPDGRFLLANVTLGDHQLRVEAIGFQAHEQSVLVTKTNITDLDVVLLPDTSRGAGYRPHVHDYWGERTEHVLMDESVEPRATRSFPNPPPAVQAATSDEYVIPIPVTEPEPNLVYPGANEVQVTLRWTQSECTASAFGLRYVAANGDEDTLASQAPGSPFVIPVTPARTDNGHQTFTLWEFYIQPDDLGPRACPGPVDVEIKVRKGSDPPLEPPHPDFWQGKHSLVLLDDAVVSGSTQTLTRRAFELPAGQLLPPGAERMRIVFWWDYGAANGTQPTLPHVLTWRTSQQYPVETPYSAYERADPVEEASQFLVYEIDLAPSQTDAFYQKRSTWQWLPSVDGFEDDYHQPDRRPRDYHLTVTVYRDLGFDASR